MEYRSVGTGPAVLYVHGAGGSVEQAHDLAERCVAQGYQVIAMSRFGYSRTVAPDTVTLAAQADAYAYLMRALGVARAVVVAVSAGVPSALEFALRHARRCAGLALIVPAVYRDARQAPSGRRPVERFLLARLLRFRALVGLLCRLIPLTLIKSIFGTPPSVVVAAPPAERHHVLQMLAELGGAGGVTGGLALDSTLTVCPDLSRYSALTAPTLAISAEDDLYRTADSARSIADALPHAQLMLYRSGGHLLLGHEAHVQEQIMEFTGRCLHASPERARDGDTAPPARAVHATATA